MRAGRRASGTLGETSILKYATKILETYLPLDEPGLLKNTTPTAARAASPAAGSTESATPIQGGVDGEDGKFESYMKQFNFQRYVLKLRAKADTWNEQTRVKVSIADVKPCDYKAESAAHEPSSSLPAALASCVRNLFAKLDDSIVAARDLPSTTR